MAASLSRPLWGLIGLALALVFPLAAQAAEKDGLGKDAEIKSKIEGDDVTLMLPERKPNVAIPVIEIILK